MIHDLWYKNAVVYSLDVETYLDANGDGWGDFEGLSRRLDYLDALGVDAVWLAPFQPSPRKDDGYDIADYYGVDPRFGSGGDFVEFMREADSRGIRVLIDLVVNHTSDRHPWFRAARDPRSPIHDWYVWSKKRPRNFRKGRRLPRGADGDMVVRPAGARVLLPPLLRLPARPRHGQRARPRRGSAHHGVLAAARSRRVPRRRGAVLPREAAARPTKPTIHFEYLKEFREFLQWRVGDAVLLGEANVPPDETRPTSRTATGCT